MQQSRCKDKGFLRRYDNSQDIYKSCDIIAELIDSSYWEVFSKDADLIDRLALKFKKTEFLELVEAKQ